MGYGHVAPNKATHRPPPYRRNQHPNDPFLQLRERYVRGELGTTEFETRLEELLAQHEQPPTADQSRAAGHSLADRPPRSARDPMRE